MMLYARAIAIAAASTLVILSSWAQTTVQQKAATTSTQGAVMQKPTTATLQQQGAATTSQDCGKPNAQGVTVPCPGNKANNPTNPLGNASGTGIGTSSGMPNANPLGTGSNITRGGPAQPTAEELAAKLKDEKSKSGQSKVKEVGPEYFTREQQLKNITAPRGVDAPAPGAANQQAGKGIETKDVHGNTTSGSKTGADLAKEISAGSTVSRDTGKKDVSKTDQVSSSKDPTSSPNDGKKVSSDRTGRDPDGNVVTIKQYSDGSKDVTTTQPSGDGGRVAYNRGGDVIQIVRFDSNLNHWVQCGRGSGKACRPSEEIQYAGKGIDPAQAEAARKRQVTLPSDNQRRPTERVTVSGETMRQMGVGNTSGNITPNDGDGTSNTPGKKPTQGIEKVDGRPGSGPGPDNPTAASK